MPRSSRRFRPGNQSSAPTSGWSARTLLLLGASFDIALRDLGLAIGALALSRLATAFELQ